MKKDFDKIPLEEIRKMIGYYEPIGDSKWEVTTIDDIYIAESQFEAEVISSLEQIKALLLKYLKK